MFEGSRGAPPRAIILFSNSAEARAQRRLIGCRTAGRMFTCPQKWLKSMGGPPFFQNKSQLFSIGACHGHTSQRLSILFSENVTPLSVWTNFVSDLDQQCPPVSVLVCYCHTSECLDQFCELEPGQHDTYIYRVLNHSNPIYRGPIHRSSIYRALYNRSPIYRGPI